MMCINNRILATRVCVLLAIVGCGEKNEDVYTGPTGAGSDIFCNEFADAGDEQSIPDDALVGSGRLKMQLVVDRGNPKDTSIVGNATYVIKNPEIGGGQQLGETSPLGEFTKTLGPGTWNVAITGGEGCENTVEAVIEAGMQLEMCVALYCEEQ